MKMTAARKSFVVAATISVFSIFLFLVGVIHSETVSAAVYWSAVNAFAVLALDNY